MTLEISYGAVGAACTVIGLAGKVVHGLVANALEARDRAIADLEKRRSEDVAALKATQKILFEKYDLVCDDLQAYKLHVAETYVNQAALEKLLLPIERRLETIEQDLRKNP